MLMMSASALNGKINGNASSSEIDVDDIPKGGYVRSPVKVAAACGALVLAIVSLGLLVEFETQEDGDEGYAGGVNWVDAKQLHNYHAIFMTSGMLVMATAGLHAWGILNLFGVDRANQKVVHGSLFLLSVVFIGIGLYAVNKSDCAPDGTCEASVTEVHHYIGVFSLAVYFAQFLAAALIFGLGFASDAVRKAFVEHHRAIGVASLALSTATILSGMEMQVVAKGSCEIDDVTFTPENHAASHWNELQPGCKTINGAAISAAFSLLLSIIALMR